MDFAGFFKVILWALFFWVNPAFAGTWQNPAALNSCSTCHTSVKDSRLLDFNQRETLAQKWAVIDKQILNWHQQQDIQIYLNTKHRQNFYQSDYQKTAEFTDIQTEVSAIYQHYNQSAHLTVGRYQPDFTDRTFKDYVFIPRLFYENKINHQITVAYGKSSLNYFDDYTQSLNAPNSVTFSKDIYGQESESLDLIYANDYFKSRISKTFYKYNYNQRLNDNQILMDVAWVQMSGSVWTLQALVDLNESNSVLGAQYLWMWDATNPILIRVEKIKTTRTPSGLHAVIQPQWVVWDKIQLYLRGSYLNPDIETTDPKITSVRAGLRLYLWAQVLLEAAIEKNQNTYTKIIKQDQESIQGYLDLSIRL